MKSITYLYLIYLVLPIGLLIVGSFGHSWVNTLLPSGVTVNWYLEIWHNTAYRQAFLMSLQVCLMVCALNLMIITPLVCSLQLVAQPRITAFARLSALLPIAAPELVIGFGFILAFTRETTPWLGTTWLLVVGHFILTFPYFFFALMTDIERSPFKPLDLVAQSFGASPLQRFTSVFMPLISKSIGTGLITVSAISLGEFQLSNLIAGFMNRTYPTLLLQAFYGATGLACAATVVLLILAVLTSLLSSYQGSNTQRGIKA
ncbi:ABC transporter permease [Vibrio nigripulchritudo]|uniref:ABC transporter permease n=1 Tax=Vibrio nigripulchritudo TaxID=28173 RepID=UPI0003B20364|nr:ABC transporter permease subunit [Vibrio nigripulchritudo]CCN86018.1 putative ABC transporter permease protein [Vibrio nigripulchritudo BLFn1]CCN97816.1 putative ABC transporter permease protein [Vibrio nigripulchritudo ENn2]CCO56127.1 putative ABC transporter permease protein [Vibrio nigripulchritudo Wn13]